MMKCNEYFPDENQYLMVPYYFNEPHKNRGLVLYPKELTELYHVAQHSMVVGVRIL